MSLEAFSRDLSSISDRELQKKLFTLENAYYLIDDRNKRMQVLLVIDNMKIELIKRGIYDPS